MQVGLAMLLRCLVAWSYLALCQGHSYLMDPPARNALRGDAESCPHCLQAGGPETVESRAGGIWPSNTVPESHGLCGDPVQGHAVELDWRNEEYLEPTPAQRTYQAGEIVEFVIAVSTHHQGHYEFKLCDKVISGDTLSSRQEGQECLDAHVLERAPLDASCVPDDPNPDCQPIDANFPGRWYLPPSGYGTYGSPSDTGLDFPYEPAEVHRMRYKIPEGFNCSHCTLQWYWSTGNSCIYDYSYFEYFPAMQEAGWTTASTWCDWCTAGWANCENACCGTNQRSFGEEFWNCADVAVTWDGNPSPTPAPTPAPTGGTAAPCSTTTGTTQVLQNCSAEHGQCGGVDWEGPFCCVAGTGCVYIAEYYWQCQAGAPAPTPAPIEDCTETTATTTSFTGTGFTTQEIGGTCMCAESTVWDGSFGQFEASPATFCSQNFGGANPYISGGGGNGQSGGHSGAEPCSSGQYSFSSSTGWKIEVPASAAGQTPYRAFAYAQLCNGQPYSNCWGGMQDITFSFSFKADGIGQTGSFVKLLFWTDGGNLLGLLPPSHPNAGGIYQLVTFMQDDYPNSWQGSLVVQDGRWYHVEVVFTPSTSSAAISIDGTSLGSGTLPVSMLTASNGPQIGVYSFDYSGIAWPQDGVTLWLDDACVGDASGQCPSGSGGAGTGTATTAATTAAPTPTLATSAAPTPAPATTAPSTTATTTQAATTTPQGGTCDDLCDQLNYTFLEDTTTTGCRGWDGEQAGCEASYITFGSVVVPCLWHECGSECHADGASMMKCTEHNLLCSCSAAMDSDWSDLQCRNLCHGHPTYCSASCLDECTAGCSCNAAVP
ncbi:putative conserved tandem cellulose binding domain [Amphidinium carterae]